MEAWNVNSFYWENIYERFCELFIAMWCLGLHLSLRTQSSNYNFLLLGLLSGILVGRGSTRRPFLHYLPCAMAKSDTWPGGVAMESLSNVDSAESCDSVISLNSGSVSSPLGLHISCPWAVCIDANVWYSKLTLRPIENKGEERTEGGVLLLPPVCTQTTTLAFITSWRQSWERFFCHSRLIRVQSEDSMEHLSAEERACLTYLEETIEALEVQEDSGLSNDEPESLNQAGKIDESRVRGR